MTRSTRRLRYAAGLLSYLLIVGVAASRMLDMSGHAIPELAIEQAVYNVVSQRRDSISAEHGIGTLKKDFLHLARSAEEIALMRAIKNAMDANGILNPGKIF